MKNNFYFFFGGTKISRLLLLFLLCLFITHVTAQTNVPLRRPVSPSSPMWLVHIDTWNYADPQKIINLIPADIRPYVVMNISLSISHDVSTSQFRVAEYGYEIAKSWIRTCAENQMWCMVQSASGGLHQFSDFDLSVYEEFFRDYPNFLGFNYAEQFWGFDDSTDPISAKWTDRIAHFADLLKLSNKYGGYLVTSWCGNQYSPSINPIGMLKRNPGFASACKQYSSNFILCEKYTTTSYKFDAESICLGSYLSGYSGQYGIRYDDSGWTDSTGSNSNFTLATGGAPHLEHMMLTGETVIDGPEIIWTNCFKENNASTTSDGFTKRSWATYAHFDNVMVDIFRKVLDGTVRIPSRKEVIDRTKLVIVNDINSSDNNATYSSPKTLFDGLYTMDGDGDYENNLSFFKKTGRYPTIPTVYQLNDANANSFQIKLNKSNYDTRWSTIASKVTELNNYFPKEYSGDLYVGRNENGWVTYNPYKTVRTAKANIPFKYNTCDSMSLTYSRYTAGVVKEYPEKVTYYLSNYDDEVTTGLKGDTIKIYGSTSEPVWSYIERGKHQASSITKQWQNGVFTLSILHNGPVDITVNCSGTATGRLTSYQTATLTAPLTPTLYTGPRQYEAECFDRKSVASVVTSGYYGTIRNYTGQGYIKFGTSSSAAVRDTINMLKSGVYDLMVRYSALSSITTIDLYVNGIKVITPTFTATATESNWNVLTQRINLNAGNNIVMLKANAYGSDNINIDNFVIKQGDSETVYDFTNDAATTSASTPAAQFVTVQSGSAGVVTYVDANNNTSNCLKPYSFGNTNGTGSADLNLFPSAAANYYIVWKEYYNSNGAKKGILLRGTGSNGACTYADGMKQGYLFITQNNSDNTVTLIPNIANQSGLTPKTSYKSSFVIGENKPCWYRASVQDSTMVFECSKDSVNWEGNLTTKFIDKTYNTGSTQLIWGLNSNNQNWLIDNISYNFKDFSVSKYQLSDLGYTEKAGLGSADSISVEARGLTDHLIINCPTNFEVSLNKSSGYTSTLDIVPIKGKILKTQVYARAKGGLSINNYSGVIVVNSSGVVSQNITLSAVVVATPFSKNYDFTNDVVSTSAQTPPAINTSIGQGNGATAGVVSFTDANNKTSNMFKPYGGGNRNATGVVDLGLFSTTGTNYSITWKQVVGSSASDYKVGVLLRGDATKIGDATTGYVQGMMPGYLFIVYTANGGTTKHSEFRIYKSTTTYNALSMLVNTTISTLVPTASQPVWYRASVSGTAPAALKFEYSTDSLAWNTGATISESVTSINLGSTQLVWGLGVGNLDFYVDNITFYGIDNGSSSSTAVNPINIDGLTIISKEYYNISGQKVDFKYFHPNGIYIVRNHMSDGSIITQKLLYNKSY